MGCIVSIGVGERVELEAPSVAGKMFPEDPSVSSNAIVSFLKKSI